MNLAQSLVLFSATLGVTPLESLPPHVFPRFLLTDMSKGLPLFWCVSYFLPGYRVHLSPCIRLRLGLSYGPFGNGVVEGSDKNEQSISKHLGQARVSQGSQAEEG